ncbi:hypothetical protein [Actinoplanes lutulentus]|nr:hypothetical protein [Actinoplanes lutulentus]
MTTNSPNRLHATVATPYGRQPSGAAALPRLHATVAVPLSRQP